MGEVGYVVGGDVEAGNGEKEVEVEKENDFWGWGLVCGGAENGGK